MFPIQDQISVAAKANIDANIALYASLTQKTLESVEKLINLNIAAVKSSMEESSAMTRKMLSAKDPQEFFSLISEQAQPKLEKAIAYGSTVATIAKSAQSEFAKATESQIAQASHKVHELIEEAAKKGPAGTESLITVMKTAMGNAGSTYEQIAKTTKQAVEAMEANLSSTVNQISQAVIAPAKA
jgi:phasin family protein